MSGRRILVTGGSGFIGTNLVAHLAAVGDDVVNLDREPPRDATQADRWVQVDVCDATAVAEAVAGFGPKVVVHLAARTDLGGATVDDYRANTDGVTNVVAAVAAAGTVERVLYGSSQLVATPGHTPTHDLDYSPPNAYGESKVIGEGIVRAALDDGVAWILLRPTSIWGPWFGELYSAFFRTVQKGRYLHPRGVRIRKSFGYVGNTVHQLDRIIDAPLDAIHRRVVYLADYEAYPIHEWAHLIQAALRAPPVREVPVWILRVLASAGDGLRRLGMSQPPITSYRLRNILTETVFDMEPLRELCGDLPFTLEEGTARTAEWLLAHQR